MVAGSLSMWVRMLEISRHIVLHLGFQAGDAIVRLLQAEPLVQFDVLLDVQLAADDPAR